MGFSLKYLQENLPWTVPYSRNFEASKVAGERHRHLMHDLMHVAKSYGWLADVAERCDHGTALISDVLGREDIEKIARKTADFVICALHIAKVYGFDLESVVVQKLEEKNRVKIHEET